MALLDKLVKEFDIRLAIHNHGPESKSYPTPHEAYKMCESFDPRIGLCMDLAHAVRGGADAVECIEKYSSRLYDLHIRDMDKAGPNGHCIEGGRGVMDLRGILKALLKIKYQYLVGIEYEKDASDPVPGLAETVGCLRGLLVGLKA